MQIQGDWPHKVKFLPPLESGLFSIPEKKKLIEFFGQY